MTEKFNSTDTLLGISADGCNGNTGWANGMIRQYELLKGKAVQWLICFYHLCELVFRGIFTTIGKLYTVGANFSKMTHYLVISKIKINFRFPL